jgi:hypothetical protein
MCAAQHANPTIVLVTVGYGGTTLYHDHTPGLSNCYTRTSNDWRHHLEAPSDRMVIPPDTPVVDCTVEGCDTVGYGIYGPLFAADLKPGEFFELGDGLQTWRGQRLSGMASCGRDVFLAHAERYGCGITYAASGEPFPVRGPMPAGEADGLNSLISYGLATDPAETISAVILGDLGRGPEEKCRVDGESNPAAGMPDAVTPRRRLAGAAGHDPSAVAPRSTWPAATSDTGEARAR